MVDAEPQPHLHPAGAAHRRAQRRKTLQLLFRKQLDDLLAAREILHRPVVPVPEPHGLRQLLGKTAPFPERRDQEAFRRQVHRLVLGAQPDRAPAAIGARGDGFVRMVDVKQQWNDRSFTIGVTYNFKSGKAFKRKAVEAGSADEKKPPVKLLGQHHGTHDPDRMTRNTISRNVHSTAAQQHPQTCTAGHSIAGYNPDRVTGNTATRKAAS